MSRRRRRCRAAQERGGVILGELADGVVVALARRGLAEAVVGGALAAQALEVELQCEDAAQLGCALFLC